MQLAREAVVATISILVSALICVGFGISAFVVIGPRDTPGVVDVWSEIPIDSAFGFWLWLAVWGIATVAVATVGAVLVRSATNRAQRAAGAASWVLITGGLAALGLYFPYVAWDLAVEKVVESAVRGRALSGVMQVIWLGGLAALAIGIVSLALSSRAGGQRRSTDEAMRRV